MWFAGKKKKKPLLGTRKWSHCSHCISMLRQKEVVAPLELSLSFFKQSVFLIFPSMPQNEAFLIDTPRTVAFLIIREPSQNERRSQRHCQSPLGTPPALCRGALRPPPLRHSQRCLQGTLPSLGRALSENKLQALIHSCYSCLLWRSPTHKSLSHTFIWDGCVAAGEFLLGTPRCEPCSQPILLHSIAFTKA